MEQFADGYFDDLNVNRDRTKGLNGLQSTISNDGVRVTVTLVRFGRKYRFWSFWNTEGLSRMEFRAQAEAVVSAKLVLEQ